MTLTNDIYIQNKRGLHARASAKLVRMAEKFDAEVFVIKSDVRVTGTSIMGLLLLAASKGEQITIETSGPEKQEAMEAVLGLINNLFDEDQ